MSPTRWASRSTPEAIRLTAGRSSPNLCLVRSIDPWRPWSQAMIAWIPGTPPSMMLRIRSRWARSTIPSRRRSEIRRNTVS